MRTHLPLGRLEPGVERSPTEAAHLRDCAKCRVEARLLAGFADEPALEEAEERIVGTVLDTVRSQLTVSLQDRSLLAVGTGHSTSRGPTAGGTPGLPAPDERYAELARLGAGGMGEVLAVEDRTLGRRVAMKVATPALQASAQGMARFVEEAQVGAQLQHPGIVPVHELGELPDGRAYFTMKEVEGQTLAEAIAGVHLASRGGWRASAGGWTVRRLVDAVRRVAETIGYAHSRGVTHRDLKPANVMLGAWGEVLVVDWGLAKLGAASPGAGGAPGPTGATGATGATGGANSRGPKGRVTSARAADDALATRLGAVAGTPAFMAPEQARGEAIGPAVDIYALGALLRVVLTGRAPYSGRSAQDVLAAVVAGPPGPMEGPAPIPDELAAVCRRAMARQAPARYPSASELARDIEAWLDGAARRERALAALDAARAWLPEARRLREEAQALDEEARTLLAERRSFDADATKLPGWDRQDRAQALREEASLAELRFVEGVRGALVHDGELPEAHAALADHYRAAHEAAEREGDAAARRYEVLLAAHDRGRHAEYLRGVGRVVLPVERATARRFEERGRRLVPGEAVELEGVPDQEAGAGALLEAELDAGSWLITAQGTDLPLVVPRAGVARRRRPGEDEDLPVRARSAVREPGDGAYVPGGWFLSGGDQRTPSSLPARRIWVDDFVISRDPVTHREYLAFLDALVAAGREREALQHAPRERPSRPGEVGGLLVDYSDGCFRLRADAEGDSWAPDWPAWMVDWSGARAYAAWRAAEDGLPWRLPWELEWEKAARGVDGRPWPWGGFADPSWACVSGSREGRPMPSAVGAHPVDSSVYGVRGTAGNVCDWVLDVFEEDGPALTEVDGGWLFSPPDVAPADDRSRCVKGGSWSNPIVHGRGAFRDGRHPGDRRWVIGFRLARSV